MNLLLTIEQQTILLTELENSVSSSQPGEATATLAPVANDLFSTLENLQMQLAKLTEDFETKIQYDQHKEKIIDNLHAELQKYKGDLLGKLVQPVLLDVISIIDDFNKQISFYQTQDLTAVSPEKLMKLLESFPTDLENLLYRQGVEPFSHPETTFNPARQRVVKSIPTEAPTLDKTVAQVVRVGYEWEGKVLRREMVNVYVYQPRKSILEETTV
jgi:molecular chaperone GrpE